MKYVGLTNPLPVILELGSIYMYYGLVTESRLTDKLLDGQISNAILFIAVTLLLVVGPLLLLAFCKLIIVDKDTITLMYPFRLWTVKFKIKELKSVYRQTNSSEGIRFKYTHLYFGSERRINFNMLEILNFSGLSDYLERLEKRPSR